MTGITETTGLVAGSGRVTRFSQPNGRQCFADVMEQKSCTDDDIHTAGQRDTVSEMEKPNGFLDQQSLPEGEARDAFVSDEWLNGESAAECLISESGPGSLMVSYPFRHLAVGLLDYQKTGSEMSLLPVSAASTEVPEITLNGMGPLTGKQKTSLIPDTYMPGIGRAGDTYPLWNWIQKNSERSSQATLSGREGMNRYAVDPHLSAAGSLLTRNISYLRSSDGQTKVVLRDYRADEVSLTLWYNQIREQLKHHQGLVINGKAQESVRVTE